MTKNKNFVKKVYNPITKDIMNKLNHDTNIRAVLDHLDVCCIIAKLDFKEVMDAFKKET